jgi:hypothetical protein
MKKSENSTENRKKLVLRKASIRALDNADLSKIDSAMGPPPDGGVPPHPTQAL